MNRFAPLGKKKEILKGKDGEIKEGDENFAFQHGIKMLSVQDSQTYGMQLVLGGEVSGQEQKKALPSSALNQALPLRSSQHALSYYCPVSCGGLCCGVTREWRFRQP